ncbi:MAG: hypothetical protein II902_07185 [Selenomonadaceae bacterium]|nr:hypothetical protein [Selenomonadaceae bacterium]
MFDTEKIRQLTFLLERMPKDYSRVYIIPEVFPQEAAALFRRLKIPVRAIMIDNAPMKELFGFKVVSTAEAVANFNRRTGLIALMRKSAPFIQTPLDFRNRGGILSLSALVMAPDEILAVYDRLTLMKILKQYQEDGLPNPPLQDFATRFARGLTTFLEPRFQNFKFQLWDSREYFKPTYDFDDTAIVIQGPITYENNYTVDTFKLYRSIYPNAPIVISTWQGEATDDFRRECLEHSVVLLENEPPEIRGLSNINMQLKSSLSGVEYVRKNTSAKFVLKTRTDQRINRFDFLVYFKNLLKTFPPKDDKLQRRIIFLCSAATKGYSFYFYDFLAFGCTSDILKLYDVPLHKDPGEMTYTHKNTRRFLRIQLPLLDNRCPIDYNFKKYPAHKLRKLSRIVYRFAIPEVYIARNFHEKYIGHVDPEKALETNWAFIRDYLILVDYNTILFDWFKYEFHRYTYEIHTKGQHAFARWLDMYNNFED